MPDEPVKKRVDESWKEQAEREKQSPTAPGAGPAAPTDAGAPPAASGPGDRLEPGAEEAPGGLPEARFDVFLSGLAMEAFVAMGDMPHPVTRKRAVNLPHAKYIVDLLGLMEEKTKGNLSADEEKLLTDALYQLRMRYLAKSGG